MFLFRIFVILVIFVNYATGDQHFTDRTSFAGINLSGLGSGAAFGDFYPPFDLAHIDLVLSTSTYHNVKFFANNGDETFTDVTSTSGVNPSYGMRGLAWGDVNNDDYVDLLGASFLFPDYPKLYLNNGDGTFTDISSTCGFTEGSYTKGIYIDYDNDGLLDVFMAGPDCSLFHNLDGTTFEDVTTDAGLSSAIADWSAVCFDFNNDFWQDIYTSHDPNCQLFSNNGDGTFTNVTSSMGCNNIGYDPTGIDTGDINNDGWIDIYIANISEWPYPDRNMFYRNDGGVGFTDITESAGVEDVGDGRLTRFIDFNNDGWTDLFSANHVNQNRLFKNEMDETFHDVSNTVNISNPWDSFGVSWCDYNVDGALDVFMSGHFDNVLLRNDECPGNFLVIHLVGVDVNRSAIGARVKITTPGGFSQYQQVDGGCGKNGQDNLDLHFGLGDNTIVNSIIVYWSPDYTEEYTDVDANQFIIITEGEGIEVTDIILLSFSAIDKGGMSIVLNWSVDTTEGEEIKGFNLFRREVGLTEKTTIPENEDSTWTQINEHLIIGDKPYSYIDNTVESGSTYEYRLEAVVEEEPTTLGTTTGTCGLPTSFAITSIHPNPVVDEMKITLSTPESVDVVIKVYDITGRLLIEKEIGKVETGEHTEILSTNDLSSGVYTIKATAGVETSINRIVVVK